MKSKKMNKRVHDIISKTIHLEGGYVNDADDPGGETNFGISKKAYPNVDIKSLTFEGAIEIAYKDYWLKINADSYTNDGYAWKCFDISFNCGLQALDLICTSIIMDRVDTEDGTDDLIKGLDIYYDEIVALRPRSKKFLAGWDKRAATKYKTGEYYTHI